MTKDEALKLLETASKSDKPSRVNRALTEAQSLTIMINGIKSLRDDVLSDLFEKRVWQVCKNQRRPKIKK